MLFLSPLADVPFETRVSRNWLLGMSLGMHVLTGFAGHSLSVCVVNEHCVSRLSYMVSPGNESMCVRGNIELSGQLIVSHLSPFPLPSPHFPSIPPSHVLFPFCHVYSPMHLSFLPSLSPLPILSSLPPNLSLFLPHDPLSLHLPYLPSGAGSITEALSLKKPLIVVINEALMNNHQTELAKKMSDEEYCICTTCRYVNPKVTCL